MNNIQIGDYFYYSNPIDKGNFSLIYKGYNLKNNTQIIVKKHLNNNNILIKNERKILEKLQHKNIVKLYDTFIQNNQYLFVMEFCNQGNLKKYIESNSIKYDYKYTFEILKGLKYLINQKIIHRDIKPSNIVIHNNIAKLTDFGLSKEINEDLHNTFCGSPLYMAPEILKYENYNIKSDIWSLGITLYELLFKHHPINEQLNNNHIIKIITNDKDLNIPNHELKFLLNKLLLKNNQQRISWNELFEDKFFKNLSKKLNYENNSNIIKNNITDDFELSFLELFEDNNLTEIINVDENGNESSLYKSKSLNDINLINITTNNNKINNNINKCKSLNNLNLDKDEGYFCKPESLPINFKKNYLLNLPEIENYNIISDITDLKTQSFTESIEKNYNSIKTFFSL